MKHDTRIELNDVIVEVDQELKAIILESGSDELGSIEVQNKIGSAIRRLIPVITALSNDTDLKPDFDNISALDSTDSLLLIYELLLGIPLQDTLQREGGLDLKDNFQRVGVFFNIAAVSKCRNDLYESISERLKIPEESLYKGQKFKLGRLVYKFESLNTGSGVPWKEFQQRFDSV